MVLGGVEEETPETSSLPRRINREHSEIATLAANLGVNTCHNLVCAVLCNQEFAPLHHFRHVCYVSARAVDEVLDDKRGIDDGDHCLNVVVGGNADTHRWFESLYSQRNTFAEIAVQSANTRTSTARSPI